MKRIKYLLEKWGYILQIVKIVSKYYQWDELDNLIQFYHARNDTTARNIMVYRKWNKKSLHTTTEYDPEEKTITQIWRLS